MVPLKYLVAILALCLLLVGGATETLDGHLDGDSMVSARMVITGFEVTDTKIEIRFTVKNDSEHEIWVCHDVALGSDTIDFEAYRIEGSETLQIRRRLNVPTIGAFSELPFGEYVRLNPGQIQTETLSLALPVSTHNMYEEPAFEDDWRASSLIISIGYYDEDLPDLVRSVLAQAEAYSGGRIREKLRPGIDETYFPGMLLWDYFGGLSWFNESNEQRISDGRVAIPYTHQTFKGEKVLQVKINGVDVSVKARKWPGG